MTVSRLCLCYRRVCASRALRWLCCSSENERESLSVSAREKERETRTDPPRPWRSWKSKFKPWWSRGSFEWSAPRPDSWMFRSSQSSSTRFRKVRAGIMSHIRPEITVNTELRGIHLQQRSKTNYLGPLIVLSWLSSSSGLGLTIYFSYSLFPCMLRRVMLPKIAFTERTKLSPCRWDRRQSLYTLLKNNK